MAIFFTKNETAKKIPPVKVGLEKDVQKLFEKNLEEILNIKFLATEYSTSFGGRIDSLGIDNNGSPVIIEYKKGQNDSVINQGLSYLRWLLDHKADFEALVRKMKISTSEVFERGEKQKREFKDHIHYTVADHLKSASPKLQEIFSMLKEQISALDESIIEEAKAKYIAYKLTTNFCDVVILRDALKIFLNIPSGELDDPDTIARDLTKPKPIGHWGNGDYEVKLEREEDIPKIMSLIKQSYTYNK